MKNNFKQLIAFWALCLTVHSFKIQNFGEYRAWEDGTFAESCEAYRYPPRFYNYDGNVGSGVYRVKTTSYEFNVYCNMEAGFDGYTTIVQRHSEKPIRVDFQRNWAEYQKGFGDPITDAEYSVRDSQIWLGLDYIYELCLGGVAMQVNLERVVAGVNYTAQAIYRDFSIGDSSTNYKLAVTYSSGDAGDSLSYHNQLQFSTFDANHDTWTDNCAGTFTGGWWYGACHDAHFTGLSAQNAYANGINWDKWQPVTPPNPDPDGGYPQLDYANIEIRQFACNARCTQNCKSTGTSDSQICLECDSPSQFLQNQQCVESHECLKVAVYKSLSGTVNVCADECPEDYEPNEEKICIQKQQNQSPVSKHLSQYSTTETSAEEVSLISEVIAWRQNQPTIVDNQIDRIEELDVSSQTECEYLIENPDQFGTQNNFNSKAKSQNLHEHQHFTEIIAKVEDNTESDFVTQIMEFWTNDKKTIKHLKYQYNQVGCSCLINGNGRICVMHLRHY